MNARYEDGTQFKARVPIAYIIETTCFLVVRLTYPNSGMSQWESSPSLHGHAEAFLRAAKGWPGWMDLLHELVESAADEDGGGSLRALVGNLQGQGAEDVLQIIAESKNGSEWKTFLSSALERAARAGETDLVDRILRAGAFVRKSIDIAAEECEWDTLLVLVAEHVARRDVAVCIDLTNEGSEVRPELGGGLTNALELAARSGALSVVKALLRAGAEFGTVLHSVMKPYADPTTRINIIRAVLDSAGSDAALGNLWEYQTPLHRAFCPESAELLLSRGAEINAVRGDGDQKGNTPLHEAIRFNRFGVAGVLLNHGADVNVCNKWGLTPLHAAADKGQHQILTALLRRHVDVNAKDHLGWTPLHFAAGESIDAELCVSKLVRGGARVNDPDVDNETPLYVACACGNTRGVRELLRWGGDESLCDKNGKRPGDVIRSRVPLPHPFIDEILGMLENAGKERNWRRRKWFVVARLMTENGVIKRVKYTNLLIKKPSINGNVGGDGSGNYDDGGVLSWVVEKSPDSVFRNIMEYLPV